MTLRRIGCDILIILTPNKYQFWWLHSNFCNPRSFCPTPILFFALYLSQFLSFLLSSSLCHGQRFFPVSVLHFNSHATRTSRHGSPRFRRRHRWHAPPPSRRRKQLRQHRRRRRQQQHAEVLHGRCSGAEDFADGGAGDEPLLHRLRHRAPRVRQTLPLQIWWRRLIVFGFLIP